MACDALQRQVVRIRDFLSSPLRDPPKAATSMPAARVEPRVSAPGSGTRGSTVFTPTRAVFTPQEPPVAHQVAAPSTRPSARRARSSPASFAAAPNRPRSSSAMRRLLVLRAIARSRRYARNPSRLCSCASRRPAAPPSRCQVVGLLAAMHPSSRASTRTTNRTRRARSDAASEA